MAALRDRTWWVRTERALATLTIVSAALGLAVSGARLLNHGAVDATPLCALLGLLSGALAWRGRVSGHAIGLLFYGLQIASYFSYDLTQKYQLLAGLSVSFVAHLPSGVLVVNGFAITMLAASAAFLCWRSRTKATPAMNGNSDA